jgi:hypothetical protein
MPAADSTEGRRGGRLVKVLFWIGVGLAPLAALLLLFGQGAGLLKLAAVLAVLAVVLIGLSITLRAGGGALGGDVEDLVYDEIDTLRDDLREDIAHAARQTHKALADKIVVLNDTVEGLRGQVDMLRGQIDRVGHVPPAMHAPPQHQPPQHGGVLRHTETVQVTRQTMLVDEDRHGTVYGAQAPPPRQPEYEQPPPIPAQRRPERHGEGESWTEQLLRERLAGRGERWASGAYPETERDLSGRRHPTGDDDRISGVRTTDRWASVRSDDRGRELRMGERRSSMQADDAGSEMRIEDRWASVRRDREEASRSRHDRPDDLGGGDLGGGDLGGGDWGTGEWGGGGEQPQWAERSWEAARPDSTGANRWSETRRERRGAVSGHGSSPAALPASIGEPASNWTSGWSSVRDGTPAREWAPAAGHEEQPRTRSARHASDDEDGGSYTNWGSDRWR